MFGYVRSCTQPHLCSSLVHGGKYGLENRCSIQLSYHRLSVYGRLQTLPYFDKRKTALDLACVDSTVRLLSLLKGW